MKVVVTGREGQVVQSLLERAKDHAGIEVVAIGRADLDLTQPDTIRRSIVAARPDVVVSAAAYTAVDRAEDEPELAFAVNAAGAGAVAAAAKEAGAPIIHISTDYVFDGQGDQPYQEECATGPQSVYGASKLDGEKAVLAANPNAVILRTAWVYSPFGQNFVKTMLRLAETRDELSVVADQWGNPTSALDIAEGILRAARHIRTAEGASAYGVYHLAGADETNWSSFARGIFAASASRQGPHAVVNDITTAQYPTKAKRPPNSRLSTAKFAAMFGWTPLGWKVSLEPVIDRLLSRS